MATISRSGKAAADSIRAGGGIGSASGNARINVVRVMRANRTYTNVVKDGRDYDDIIRQGGREVSPLITWQDQTLARLNEERYGEKKPQTFQEYYEKTTQKVGVSREKARLYSDSRDIKRYTKKEIKENQLRAEKFLSKNKYDLTEDDIEYSSKGGLVQVQTEKPIKQPQSYISGEIDTRALLGGKSFKEASKEVNATKKAELKLKDETIKTPKYTKMPKQETPAFREYKMYPKSNLDMVKSGYSFYKKVESAPYRVLKLDKISNKILNKQTLELKEAKGLEYFGRAALYQTVSYAQEFAKRPVTTAGLVYIGGKLIQGAGAVAIKYGKKLPIPAAVKFIKKADKISMKFSIAKEKRLFYDLAFQKTVKKGIGLAALGGLTYYETSQEETLAGKKRVVIGNIGFFGGAYAAIKVGGSALKYVSGSIKTTAYKEPVGYKESIKIKGKVTNIKDVTRNFLKTVYMRQKQVIKSSNVNKPVKSVSIGKVKIGRQEYKLTGFNKGRKNLGYFVNEKANRIIYFSKSAKGDLNIKLFDTKGKFLGRTNIKYDPTAKNLQLSDKYYRTKPVVYNIGAGNKQEAAYSIKRVIARTFKITKGNVKKFTGRDIKQSFKGEAEVRLIQTDISTPQIEYIRLGTKGKGLKEFYNVRQSDIKYSVNAKQKPDIRIDKLEYIGLGKDSKLTKVLEFIKRPDITTQRELQFRYLSNYDFSSSRVKPLKLVSDATIKLVKSSRKAQIGITKTKVKVYVEKPKLKTSGYDTKPFLTQFEIESILSQSGKSGLSIIPISKSKGKSKGKTAIKSISDISQDMYNKIKVNSINKILTEVKATTKTIPETISRVKVRVNTKTITRVKTITKVDVPISTPRGIINIKPIPPPKPIPPEVPPPFKLPKLSFIKKPKAKKKVIPKNQILAFTTTIDRPGKPLSKKKRLLKLYTGVELR